MEITKTNGWNMLDSYKEGQAIYGRDIEIASISESIQYNIQTFLYGKSGIGKTSLIQAGVFPKLRKANFFPVVIRLAFYEGESLNSVVKRLVLEEAQTSNPEFGKYPLSYSIIDNSEISGLSLYDFFAKVQFEDENKEPFIPVLIFDQFEETINNEDNWQRTVDFLKDDFYDLMDNSNVICGESLPYTNYRVVISMREDYLYCLEDIVDRYAMWELRYNRFRIKALDDDKAAEIIRRTSGTNGIETGKEDKIVSTIIKIVKLNSGTRFTEINTALLSLVCSLLYENSTDNCIYYADLRNINQYLQSYYDDICSEIGNEATRYLEIHLLTKDGRRSSMDEKEALDSNKIDQKKLDYLVEKKLLRKIRTSNTSMRYEYIHDLFAKMVYKRIQEDKSKWYYPELRSLSKEVDESSFIRRFLLTFVCTLALSSLYLIFHNKSEHGIWGFFPTNFHCNITYALLFGISVYLFPLITQRLHNVGKSGWLCFTVPISLLLINLQHFTPKATESFTIMVEFLALSGYLLIGYFIYLMFRPSQTQTRRPGYSKKYESVFNRRYLNNFEFAKALGVELIWWTVCCCMTDMLYHALDNRHVWGLFNIELPLMSLDKFGIRITLPAVFAFIPLVIMLSPALKARVKSLGYPVWISYIPYLNILLLFEGLIPDSFLLRLKLINPNRSHTKQVTDNIFAEVSDDFVVVENAKFKTVKNKEALLRLFIPFYAVAIGINRNKKIGIRWYSMIMAVINSYSWLLFIIVLDDLKVFKSWLLLILSLLLLTITFFVSLVGLVLFSLRRQKEVLKIIKNNPTYTLNQIATELALKPSFVEKRIRKLKEKGKIQRIEENGQIRWEVINNN